MALSTLAPVRSDDQLQLRVDQVKSFGESKIIIKTNQLKQVLSRKSTDCNFELAQSRVLGSIRPSPDLILSFLRHIAEYIQSNDTVGSYVSASIVAIKVSEDITTMVPAFQARLTI